MYNDLKTGNFPRLSFLSIKAGLKLDDKKVIFLSKVLKTDRIISNSQGLWSWKTLIAVLKENMTEHQCCRQVRYLVYYTIREN